MFAIFDPTASETDILDEIGHTFSVTLDGQGGAVAFVSGAVVLVALAVVLVRWIRKEPRNESLEVQTRDAIHEAAVKADSLRKEKREWVRVPAHVRLTLHHTSQHNGHRDENAETLNLSAGGVAFKSAAALPLHSPLHLSLNLGDKRALALQGLVVRVEPGVVAGAPCVVALKFEPIGKGQRERIARWVARQQRQEIELARRGRVCPWCNRPLPDDVGDLHPSCAVRRDEEARGTVAEEA